MNTTLCSAVVARFLPGLLALQNALHAARDCRADEWEFALEIEHILIAGLDHTDLRLLIRHGLIEHGIEDRSNPGAKRTFRRSPSLGLHLNSCFILTAAGLSALAMLPMSPAAAPVVPPAPMPTSGGAYPCWNTDRRELRWGRLVIKQFRLPARNQELILAAFEEEGWPLRLDDPLPRIPDLNPKVRLHDTIKCLNRNQRHRLLQFGGDGTGMGITWRWLSTGIERLA